ncbi:MAG: hypothetical protein KIT79_13600 [Deltaproteobacteria bacterium]|nr:hypothetical protein [Deltaproteobacteria bacterium]
MEVPCPACGKTISVTEPVGRRDTCQVCGADLHVCLHCRHYDTSAYNECREPQADRVVDKDRPNFCDWFHIRTSGDPSGKTDPKAKAKAALEGLFGKK